LAIEPSSQDLRRWAQQTGQRLPSEPGWIVLVAAGLCLGLFGAVGPGLLLLSYFLLRQLDHRRCLHSCRQRWIASGRRKP